MLKIGKEDYFNSDEDKCLLEFGKHTWCIMFDNLIKGLHCRDETEKKISDKDSWNI